MNVLEQYTSYLKYVPLKREHLGYIGWSGHENLGDEVLFFAARDLFQKDKLLPYKDTKKTRWMESVLNKKLYQRVCLGGGTLINSKFYLDELISAQQRYNKTFTFGSGVLDPTFYKGQYDERCLDQWKPVLEECFALGVRGPISKEILEAKGVKRVQIIGDPALYFANDRIKPKQGTKKIGINLGTAKGMVWGSEEEILNYWAQLVKVLLEKRWEVSILPVRPRDLPYIEELRKRVGRSIEIFKSYLDLPKVLSYLEECDLFIGEKLHATILAICTHTPSIMIEYQPKCLDFMRSMDLADFNMRTDDLSVEKTLQMVDKLHGNSAYYQEFIFKRTSEYKRRLMGYVRSVNENL